MIEFSTASKRRVADAAPAAAPKAQEIQSNATLENAPSAKCACGGGCPSCRNKPSDQPLKDQIQEIASEPGTPLATSTSARISQAMHSQSNRVSPLLHTQPKFDAEPLAISEPSDQEEIDAEETTGSVLRILSSGSDEPPEKPARLFDNVRIHADERAASIADAVDAQALTFGNHVLFAKGRFNPGTMAGDRVLVHELAHTMQPASSTANALHRLPPDAAPVDPASVIDTRSFKQLWDEFDRLRYQLSDKSAEAIALVPSLIARMVTDDAIEHAGDLALWLIKREEHALAIRTLDQLEDAWWIRHATGKVPVSAIGGFGMPTSPSTFVEVGEAQAEEGNDETAHKLLGVAHLMVQMMIARIYEQDRNDQIIAEDFGEAGPNVVSIGRMLREGDLASLTTLRSRILNVYPALAAEAHRLGDTAAEVQLMDQGMQLSEDAANTYTLADMPDTSNMLTPVGPPVSRKSAPRPSSKSAVAPTANPVPANPVQDMGTAVSGPAPVAVPPPSPDRVVNGAPPFEGGTALALPGNHYVSVKSERYAVSEVLVRATAWAQNLFGVNSSIVVAHVDEDNVIRYYAAALNEDLTETFPSVNPMQSIAAKVSIVLEALPNNYDIMVIHVGNGVGFWPSKDRLAGFEAIRAKQQKQWPEKQNLEPVQVHTEVFSDIDAMTSDVEENREEIARRLSQLDATAFATLNTDQRMSYLVILLDAWTFQAQERAVVEIMKSVTSYTELMSIIERLKTAGRWEALIDDLDHELWTLLSVVGERFGKDELTVKDIYRAMADAGLLTIGTPIPGLSIGPNGPEFGIDVFAQIEEAANSFVRFLEGIWDAIVMLITQPDKIVEGVGQLCKMILVFKLADMGYVPAMTMRAQILQQFGIQLSNGFKGITVLGVGMEVVRRIKWAIIWEVASFFIGVGEIKAAMTAMGASARVGAVAKFLRLLGLAGKAVEAEEAIGGLTRLAGILGRSSKVLRTEEEVLVALSHLPEDDAVKLGRALEGLELKDGMSLSQLSAAHPELGELANASLKRAEVIHHLASKAGGFSDDVARLFARMSGGGHDMAQLEKIIAKIPEGEGARFLKTMSMITDDAALAGEKGLATLEMLAQSAEKMKAVERFGFKAVDALMEKAGRNAAETDKYLAALAAMEREFPEATRASKMQEFVEAIANKDADALAKLEQRVNPSAAKPATPIPPKDTAPVTAAPKDAALKDPAPKDPAPTDPAPKDPAPKDPAPKDPAPTDPAPTDPSPKDPAPTTTAPKEAPKTQDPAELKKLGIDAEAPQVLDAADFSKVQLKPGQDALYILRDADGNILKVGKTSESAASGRFSVYKRAGAAKVEVYPLKASEQTAESFEKALRAKMSAEGHAMPWDNTGGRLGRPGFGTPGEGVRKPPVSMERIKELLTLHKGNLREVGKELGVHRRTADIWAKSYGLKPKDFR
ncbi:MAG: eCIS core domain-containing protein [Arenimonas sp.]